MKTCFSVASADKSHGLFGHPLTDEGVCLVMPLIKFLKMEKSKWHIISLVHITGWNYFICS